MEDKKVFNKAEGLEAFQELELSDLENVAGGRVTRKRESKSYNSACIKMEKIIDKCPSDTVIRRYKDAFLAARTQWLIAVDRAPEDSADILFTDYFNPQKVYDEILHDYLYG